ncbi:MMTA2 protein, partial [Polypterus senegalus]
MTEGQDLNTVLQAMNDQLQALQLAQAATTRELEATRPVKFNMFGSCRAGGVRGGQDQFSWDEVKGDKHRENYLGNSLMAPVELAKGKDLTWYAKEKATEGTMSKQAELLSVQQAEQGSYDGSSVSNKITYLLLLPNSKTVICK